MGQVKEFGILKAGPHVNLRDLHPESRERVRDLFAAAQSTGLGTLMVYSGARTHAHQLRLYRAYLARGRRHPIVANPNRGYGSKHQVRPVKYKHGNLPNEIPAAFATDIQWSDRRFPSADERGGLKDLAAAVGLAKTVSTEWWHFEPMKQRHVKSILGIGYAGPAVSRLQTMLNSVDDAGLVVDGQYGPATYGAVADWQKRHFLSVTGDWCHADQETLLGMAAVGMKGSKVGSTVAKTESSPDVAGIDHNPTEYQTNRLVRQRAREIRDLADPGSREHELADEIAKLVYHEQND